MEFNDSQIYRAPSIKPKIGRRTISSPIIRGAQSVTTPKLKKTKFSFVRPRLVNDNKPLVTEVTEENSFFGTNKILIEIQKQLKFDFLTRILEKRNELKSEKIKLNKERAEEKESSIESKKKEKEGLKPFDKVKERVKSIFERIIDFFSIIATGLVVNNAFIWISKKENREKVKQFFDFVGKYWKELLALFIGYKITKLILKIKRLADLFGRKPPGGGGGGPLDCAGVMKCFATSVVPFLAANPTVVNQLGQSFIKSRQFLTGLATALGISALLSGTQPVKPPQTTPTTQQPVTRQPITQQPTTQPSNWSAGFWALLTAAGYSTIEIIKALGAVGLSLAGAEARAQGGTIGEFPTKKCTSCSLGFSGGGTIPGYKDGGSAWERVTGTVRGIGSGMVDSVKAMLAPGEEVIPASPAMLFRPLLKDISQNAGRKWLEFSNAVRDMISSNQTMKSALKELNIQLQIFKKQLNDFVNQEKNKPGGGGYRLDTKSLDSSKTSLPTLVLPTAIVHSNLGRPSRPVSRTTIPINLPTKTSDFKMPTIEGGMATDEPDVQSVNMSNEWMMVTPGMYGVFV